MLASATWFAGEIGSGDAEWKLSSCREAEDGGRVSCCAAWPLGHEKSERAALGIQDPGVPWGILMAFNGHVPYYNGIAPHMKAPNFWQLHRCSWLQIVLIPWTLHCSDLVVPWKSRWSPWILVVHWRCQERFMMDHYVMFIYIHWSYPKSITISRGCTMLYRVFTRAEPW